MAHVVSTANRATCKFENAHGGNLVLQDCNSVTLQDLTLIIKRFRWDKTYMSGLCSRLQS